MLLILEILESTHIHVCGAGKICNLFEDGVLYCSTLSDCCSSKRGRRMECSTALPCQTVAAVRVVDVPSNASSSLPVSFVGK